MSIIFNEKEHAKRVIKKGIQTPRSKGRELQLAANYLREEGYNDKQIELELHRISKKSFSDYNKVSMYEFIDRRVKRSKKGKLKTNEPVNITETEMKTILGEENVKYQKLMFVYLVLAKFYMENNHTDKYYVGCSDTEIFKLCDMYTSRQEKREMMHYLTKKGYIEPTRRMSSIVKYVDEDSNVVMKIVPDETMVYSFEKEYLDGIFINCERCGKLAKKTSNRMKYCKDCAREIHNSGTQI